MISKLIHDLSPALSSVLTFLIFTTLSPIYAEDAEVCGLSRFLTWHEVHFYRGHSVKVTNLDDLELNSHTMMGKLFKDEHGRVFLLPDVSVLIGGDFFRRHPGIAGDYSKAYYEALRVLTTIPGGAEFLRYQVSEEILHWHTRTDNISHVGEDVPSWPTSTRTNRYRLPNGNFIYLSKQALDTLVNRWAVPYRTAPLHAPEPTQ